MSVVFKGREKEEERLKSTLEGQNIRYYLIDMAEKSNLPVKAWEELRLGVIPDNQVPYTKCNEYMLDIVNEVKNGNGLYIHGGVGTGKSSWAYKIGRKYIATLAYNKIRRNTALYFANVPELLNNLKEAFNDPQYMKELNHKIENADLVIFDDIGAENTTEWAKEQLYHYINHRYSNGKSTIFTSNLPPNSLEQRVADRVKEMTTIVKFSGQSRR